MSSKYRNGNHKYDRVAHLWEQIKVSCYYMYVLPVRLYHDNDYRYLLIEVELMVLLGTVSHIFVINNNNNWIISRLHVLSVYYIYEKNIYISVSLYAYKHTHTISRWENWRKFSGIRNPLYALSLTSWDCPGSAGKWGDAFIHLKNYNSMNCLANEKRG